MSQIAFEIGFKRRDVAVREMRDKAEEMRRNGAFMTARICEDAADRLERDGERLCSVGQQ